MMKVLFVCLGNICRSPAAEGVFLNLLSEHGLEKLVYVDSAGTSGYHVGEPADARMIEHAKKRGTHLPSRARKFVPADFEEFDYILTMDRNNYWDVRSQTQDEQEKAKVIPFTDFCRRFDITEVPDPYFGGDAGFEHVLDIVEDASQGLLEKINKELNK